MAAKTRRFEETEVTRAAYLAGSGASAEEIAAALGVGVTVEAIYRLLKRLGIRLMPKSCAQVSIPVAINVEMFESITRAAIRRGVDPQEAAGKILDAIAENTQLLEKIMSVAIPDNSQRKRAA